MENRNGLIVQETVSRATGTAERDSALSLLDRLRPARPARSARIAATTRATSSPLGTSAASHRISRVTRIRPRPDDSAPRPCPRR